MVIFVKEKKMGIFSYSSSGTSDSVASLQLNCNSKKFVTNNAPNTIKKVVMIFDFIQIRCRFHFRVA